MGREDIAMKQEEWEGQTIMTGLKTRGHSRKKIFCQGFWTGCRRSEREKRTYNKKKTMIQLRKKKSFQLMNIWQAAWRNLDAKEHTQKEVKVGHERKMMSDTEEKQVGLEDYRSKEEKIEWDSIQFNSILGSEE